MQEPSPVIFIVDDEPSVRTGLKRLLRSVGMDAQTFASSQEFLDAARPADVLGCLVLDVRLPGLSGLDLQFELAKAHVDLPIIFVTGHGDIPMTVRAMKAGAVEFLAKPFKEQDVLEAIQHALTQHRAVRQRRAETAALERRYNLLTSREREVFPLVSSGLLNKQIAAELGTSEKTVKVHRGQVMLKMQAGSLADLVRMAGKLGIPSPKP